MFLPVMLLCIYIYIYIYIYLFMYTQAVWSIIRVLRQTHTTKKLTVRHVGLTSPMALRQPLQCLGSFQSLQTCPVAPFSAQEVLQLACFHMSFHLSLHCLFERTISCIPWRVRIHLLLPTLLVFHSHLMHLQWRIRLTHSGTASCTAAQLGLVVFPCCLALTLMPRILGEMKQSSIRQRQNRKPRDPTDTPCPQANSEQEQKGIDASTHTQRLIANFVRPPSSHACSAKDKVLIASFPRLCR